MGNHPSRCLCCGYLLLADGDTVSWRLAKSLDKLREQVNKAAPKRSKASDGSIGDAAHRARGSKSDHNPNSKGVVTAIDITHDPKNGCDCHKLAEALRLSKDPRIDYVIFAGRIFSSHVSPWAWRKYTGSNPHNKHLHISVKDAKADGVGEWAISAKPEFRIVAAGKTIEGFVKDGVSYAPVRALGEALGFTVDYDPEANVATVKK